MRRACAADASKSAVRSAPAAHRTPGFRPHFFSIEHAAAIFYAAIFCQPNRLDGTVGDRSWRMRRRSRGASRRQPSAGFPHADARQSGRARALARASARRRCALRATPLTAPENIFARRINALQISRRDFGVARRAPGALCGALYCRREAAPQCAAAPVVRLLVAFARGAATSQSAAHAARAKNWQREARCAVLPIEKPRVHAAQKRRQENRASGDRGAR